jgi:hypothetical protein
MERFAMNLCFPSVTYCRPPLRDDFGMLPAIAVLDRSLAKEFIRNMFSGAHWKARSVVTNITQTGVSGFRIHDERTNRNRTWISSVTNSPVLIF